MGLQPLAKSLSPLGVVTRVAGTTLENGLAFYYPMDEASGNRRDVKGQNTLLDFGGVGSAAGLVYPLAATFDPAQTPWRYLFWPIDNGGFNFAAGDFTVAIWTRIHAYPANGSGQFYGMVADFAGGGYRLIITSQAHQLAAQVFSPGLQSATDHNNGPVNMTLDTWHLLTIKYLASIATVYAGWDNDAFDSGAVITNGEFYGPRSGGGTYIGLESDSIYPFNGRIGPIIGWNRAITDSERTLLFNGGNGLSYENIAVAPALPLPPLPSGTWYLTSGITGANVITAYQAKGARTYWESKLNLASGLTNIASEDNNISTLPVWDAVNGVQWTGGLLNHWQVPDYDPAHTIIIRFANLNQDQAILFGHTAANSMYVEPNVGASVVRWINGAGGLLQTGPVMSSGVIAIAGTNFYRNGVKDNGLSGQTNLLAATGMQIANSGYGSLLAYAHFNTTLNDTQVAAISAQMAVL